MRDGPEVAGRATLLTLAAVGLLGLLLLLRVEARGGPAWPFGVYLPLLAAALAACWWRVYRPARARAGDEAARAAAAGRQEEALLAALDHLRAGDLVHGGAAAGDLDERLGAHFLDAARGLELLAQQIQSSSLEVAGAAHAVNQIAAELASGSSQQSASVVEITAAMEELAKSAAQIAASAAEQAGLAQRAESIGEAGRTAVAQAVDGVEEMRKRIRGIAERAEVLDRRSREIFRVLDLVTEIAQETHILSLNAAIEAAAAGGHGQRFASVADEVRRLAQRSHESVQSVRRLVSDFVASVHATVVATEEGAREAAGVRAGAQAAAGAIGELQAAAADGARAAREISAATAQQDSASHEVLLTLREASVVVQRMAEGLNRFLDTARRLNQLGLSTQLLAQGFHLDSPHSLKHRAESWAAEVRRSLRSWEAIERRLQEWVEGDPFVECAYFLEAEGGRLALAANRQILGERPVPAAVREGEGFTERPWYRLATREGRTVVTPAFTSLLSSQQIVTAAAPVRAEDGRLLGVLGLDVNVDLWTQR